MSRILNWITGDQRNQQPASKRMFTPEEVLDIRTRRASGATVKALAKRMDVSEYIISRICCGLDYVDCPGPVRHRRRRMITNEDMITILALHTQGLSNHEIGRRVNRQASVVRRTIERVNVIVGKNSKTP